jgi:hypothetical protein
MANIPLTEDELKEAQRLRSQHEAEDAGKAEAEKRAPTPAEDFFADDSDTVECDDVSILVEFSEVSAAAGILAGMAAVIDDEDISEGLSVVARGLSNTSRILHGILNQTIDLSQYGYWREFD